MKNNYLKPILVVLLLSVCTTVIYAKKFRVGDLYYRTSKYSSVVYVYKAKNVETIVIPSTVTYKNEEYKVVGIEKKAFKKHEKLMSITIPPSITFVGSDAFLGCNGLSAVHISDMAAWYNIADRHNMMLQYVDKLYLNGKLVTQLVIPDGVTSIGYCAFKGCTGLKSVVIPNSVTSIEFSAFEGCTGLTSITIPNSVTSIEFSAFEGCTGLTEITIPNSVTSIGGTAFRGCSGLTSIEIPNSVTSIGYGAFEDCDGLTSIEIPNSVTSIEFSAFSGCTGLTSITIPNSVTSIGDYAFYDCTGLEKIELNCETIGSWFRLKNSIKEVILGNSVTSIGEDAFSGCTGLTSITIPNSVTSIGYCAFEGCTGLKSVVIPNSVTSIGKRAFMGCTNLTSVVIPNSVTSIGSSAFLDCTGLTSVTIGDGVTSIGSSAFYGCSKLNCVQVGDNVKVIGDYAFSRCSNLSVMTKLDSVANISEKERILRKRMILHDYFFNNCRIPVNVEYIGSNAFYQCSKLENVIIPSATKRIGLDAFGDCDGLASIDVALDNPVYDSRDNCNAIIKTSTNEFIVECKNTTIPDDIRKEREIANAKKQAELMAAAEAKRKKQQAIAQAMFGLVGIAADAYVNSQNHNHVHSQQSYSNNYGNYSSSYSGITSPPVLDANKVVADFNAYQQAELQKKFIATNTYRKNAGLSEYSWQEFLAINAEEEAKAYQMRAQWQNAPNRNETSSSNAGEAATRVSSSGSGNSHSSSHSTSCPSLRIGNGEWYCGNTGKCGMCGGDGLMDGSFGLKPNSLKCTLCEGTGKCKYCQ